MPYRDPEIARQKSAERMRRMRARRTAASVKVAAVQGTAIGASELWGPSCSRCRTWMGTGNPASAKNIARALWGRRGRVLALEVWSELAQLAMKADWKARGKTPRMSAAQRANSNDLRGILGLADNC